MADRYLVLIVEPTQFCMSELTEQEKDQYTLYESYQKGEELPDGVWVEMWYVPDGEDWDSGPQANAHQLCNHQTYLIEWDEIGRPEDKKETDWWVDRQLRLEMLHKIMEAAWKDANSLLEDDVIPLLDPDTELLTEEMVGDESWRDYDTVQFYAGLIAEKMKEAEKSD